jgi:hypothetical protein
MRKYHVGGKKKTSRKMPREVLAHFMAKTLLLAKRKGIIPKLMRKRH